MPAPVPDSCGSPLSGSQLTPVRLHPLGQVPIFIENMLPELQLKKHIQIVLFETGDLPLRFGLLHKEPAKSNFL